MMEVKPSEKDKNLKPYSVAAIIANKEDVNKYNEEGEKGINRDNNEDNEESVRRVVRWELSVGIINL